MPTKREVVGLWPCFKATIRLLCHSSREYIFVISREATTSTFFCCHIAWMQARGRELYVASRSMTHKDIIFMLYRDERTTIIHF